ncbi:cathepsin O-like isoform X1 [Spodoptera litura]|uniref:Cathepsin O-like isoform X1 n=1 Tax=Spodoptera litura TaxID=69820 RepID=A0A9J7ISE4_SPOLT|nr:cathepsin O-like isoform X1 [Spodoptera litura]
MNNNIILFVVFLFSSLFIVIELWAFMHTYNSFKVNLKEGIEVLDLRRLKFQKYLKDFNKSYEDDEHERRFENFKASLKDIARLNKLEGRKVFGLTKFSDMSKEEFVEQMLLKPIGHACVSKQLKCTNTEHESLSEDRVPFVDRYDDQEPPENFDWRNTKGVVNEILNQKRCRGCWAFSIVGVIESMSVIQKIDHEHRSIQELLDCSQYNKGCDGGSVSKAMDYTCIHHMPFVSDQEYPLTLAVKRICKLPTNATGRRVQEYAYQCNLDENKMVKQVAFHGPLVVAVDATNWLNYIGGVITRACWPGIGNHIVQLIGYVGYGTHNDSVIPHYILKNSYGEDFGENGYVKIAMHKNTCGIRDEVTILSVY